MIIGRAFLFYFIIFSHWACGKVTPLAQSTQRFSSFFLRELCTLTQSVAKKEVTYFWPPTTLSGKSVVVIVTARFAWPQTM